MQGKAGGGAQLHLMYLHWAPLESNARQTTMVALLRHWVEPPGGAVTLQLTLQAVAWAEQLALTYKPLASAISREAMMSSFQFFI